MKSYAIPWNPMGSYGILCNSVGSYKILWNLMGSQRILWNSMESLDILMNPMESYEMLWDPMESHGNLWNPMGSYGTLWKPKAYEILSNLTESHEILESKEIQCISCPSGCCSWPDFWGDGALLVCNTLMISLGLEYSAIYVALKSMRSWRIFTNKDRLYPGFAGESANPAETIGIINKTHDLHTLNTPWWRFFCFKHSFRKLILLTPA